MRRAGRISWTLLVSLGTILAGPGLGLAAQKILADGSTGVMPLVAALAKAYEAKSPGVVVEIGKGLGTRARIAALAEGRLDIALASHGLVVEELSRQGMAVHEIAKVAVVFGVNPSVPMTNLTERQVCDIYAGRVTHWREVGGPDLAVAPRTRPETEVDAEVARAKIGCLRDLKMPTAVKVMARSGDMARELAATAGAIGMTTMTVIEQSRGQIKPLSLNGIAPSAENVKRKTYVLTRDSFLVTRAQPSPAVASFLGFVRSPEGAAVIVNNGAVPLP